MKFAFGLLVSALISSQTFASANRPELRRVLDYKTHTVVCTAESDRVVVDTYSRLGGGDRKVKKGKFFDDRLIQSWIELARYEPMVKYIHIRESIPNVKFEASGLLITFAGGHSVIRDGNFSWSLVRLMNHLCGPVDG
ncbi:MAG: hypothetical protein ABL958_10345 [Bdellovibrionia bacterium]